MCANRLSHLCCLNHSSGLSVEVCGYVIRVSGLGVSLSLP